MYRLLKSFFYVLTLTEFMWAPALRYMRYLNPCLWRCYILHGLEKETKWKPRPFGMGGGMDVTGQWCQKCCKMYLRQDFLK